MPECNLSGHRMLSVSESYHKCRGASRVMPGDRDSRFERETRASAWQMPSRWEVQMEVLLPGHHKGGAPS